MNNGWVKIHRQIFESEVFTDPNLLHLFVWCIMKANVKTKEWSTMTIHRGSFVTGRESGSHETKTKPKTFYDRMKKLEKMGLIRQQTDNKCTLVTVVKYCEFQDVPSSPTTNRQPSDNKPTTIRQQTDTTKEGKKERTKEVKNERDFAFDQFWSFVPLKKNKDKARTAWRNLSGSDQGKALEAIQVWRNSDDAKDDIKGRIHMATWLNQRRFNDDPASWMNPRKPISKTKQTLQRIREMRNNEENRNVDTSGGRQIRIGNRRDGSQLPN